MVFSANPLNEVSQWTLKPFLHVRCITRVGCMDRRHWQNRLLS